ncbi:hypothetical protein Q5H91_08635 [Sphingomonas sp. KR1UV-12]|uniref:Uncharacterized protein n=1 Tax=Sphingomonas aurea TaxID=3063994 RepID=A0ABT9EK27_9SPHN|nr:hypothetical protein [Sphingomonas sp. KR1UV-12]MDP1027276.1 hypothetical protein [Sphingomonas sp. KR1UV-12]
MTDRQQMQAGGGDGHKGASDGVSDAPAKQGGGESGGGAYPNPQTGKTPEGGGFMGHGGQTDIDYSGPGGKDQPGGNANAVTDKE